MMGAKAYGMIRITIPMPRMVILMLRRMTMKIMLMTILIMVLMMLKMMLKKMMTMITDEENEKARDYLAYVSPATACVPGQLHLYSILAALAVVLLCPVRGDPEEGFSTSFESLPW